MFGSEKDDFTVKYNELTAEEFCAMPDKIPFYERFGFDSNEAQRLRIMYQVK